jgi:hypothetical protein
MGFSCWLPLFVDYVVLQLMAVGCKVLLLSNAREELS